MTTFKILTSLAAFSATAFGVFLNAFDTNLPPSPDQKAPVVIEESSPVAPALDRGAIAPLSNDRTILGAFPGQLQTVNVPAGTPRPFPTNAWWSSGALEQWPAPLFPWPLKVTISAAGFEITAPDAEVVPKAVVQAPRDLLNIRPAGVQVSRARPYSWGDFDTTFRVEQSNGSTAYDVTLMQGSPFVFIRSSIPSFEVTLPPGARTSTVSCHALCGSALLITAPQRTYLLTTSEKGTIEINGTTAIVRLPGSGMISVASVADGSAAEEYLPYALRPITGTRATYKVGAGEVTTTYTFPETTLVGVFPHHAATLRTSPGRLVGSYPTVRGKVDLYEGSSFTTSVPRPPLLPALPVTESLKNDADFRATLADELGSLTLARGDVYAAGKEVLKTAQLTDIADQIGYTELRDKGVQTLRAMLADWCTAGTVEGERMFAYENRLGGIVAIPAAFGSEHFNDHHFHYGYFLEAGATLARLDPTFVSEYGNCMKLLVRDIASANREDVSFPYLRYFDPYMSHSWANGLTLFGDGQNQESTSEALQAWHGVALWGKVSGDKEMENLGTWLLSQETLGAQAYWFDALSVSTLPEGFPHPMISILWGGKVDYATFFDPSPEAIQGIQFFPVGTPLLSVLNQDIITRLVSPVARTAGENIWKYTLTLSAALDGTERSIAKTAPIDPVFSRTYINHWLKSLATMGAYRGTVSSMESCGVAFTRNGKTTVAVYRFAGDGNSCTLFDRSTGKTVTVNGLSVGWNVKQVSL